MKSFALRLAAVAGTAAALHRQAPQTEMRAAAGVSQDFDASLCNPDPKSWEGFGVEDFYVCKINETESCPMSKLQLNSRNAIKPPAGAGTRCISNKDPDYYFQVKPGKKDKVLLYFDAGGACWNQMTYDVNACDKQQSWPTPPEGVMSDRPENPYLDYTVIFIMYCSGDLLSGNVVQSFHSRDNQPVHQHGYNNTMSALRWAKENTAPELESLVLSGMSAGSIAVQVWAHKLLSEWKYKRASVIVDSFAGAFPVGFQGPIFQGLGVCDLDLIHPSLKEQCRKQTITIAGNLEAAMTEFPNVRFGLVTSMHDTAQVMFYGRALLLTGRLWQMKQTESHFVTDLGKVVKQHTKYPNFHAYVVPSNWHVLTSCDRYYKTVVHSGGDAYTLAAWMHNISNSDVDVARNLCEDMIEESDGPKRAEANFCSKYVRS